MTQKTFDIQIVEDTGAEGLRTTWRHNITLDEVLKLISTPPTRAVDYEISHQKETVVCIMRDATQARLILWPQIDRCCYLCSSEPDPDDSAGEYVNIGWDTHSKWMVTNDIETALEATKRFLTTGEPDPSLQWHCEDTGTPFEWDD